MNVKTNLKIKIRLRWLAQISAPLMLTLLIFFVGPAVVLADDGVPLHGFADAGWGSGGSGQPARERTKGFVLGTVDLYLTPQFSDNVRSLIEIALEPSLDSQSYGLDVERIQVGYQFSDKALIWVGRFHTPYGYWNTAYHHGAEIQPSIYKPRFLDWEDHAGILPAHSTGLWFTGKTSLGSGKVAYDLWAANGSRNVSGQLDMSIIRDNNDNTALGGRLAYRFGGALDGLAIGVHGLSEEVDNVASADSSFIQQGMINMYGAFAVYETERLEMSSELYMFRNPNPNISNSPTYNSMAWFAHLGVYLTPDLILYGRYEQANLDQDDPYFTTQINGFSYLRGVIGARYNLSARTCVKLEGNRTSILDTPNLLPDATSNGAVAVPPATYSELRAQYAISF